MNELIFNIGSTFQLSLTLFNYHPHFSIIPRGCVKEGSVL